MGFAPTKAEAIFPAYAGVSLLLNQMIKSKTDIPRVCGGEPQYRRQT